MNYELKITIFTKDASPLQERTFSNLNINAVKKQIESARLWIPEFGYIEAELQSSPELAPKK